MNSLQHLLGRIPDLGLREEITRSLERRGHSINRLYIPSIGDQIKLIEPWTFPLYCEKRNKTLAEALDVDFPAFNGRRYYHSNSVRVVDPKRVTVPEGTVLTVDRIYVRQNQSDFESITFKTRLEGYRKQVRFWAKLRDCDTICFVPVSDGS